jgi:hypothetical protein
VLAQRLVPTRQSLDEDRLIIGQVSRECAVKVVEGDPDPADAVSRVVAGHGEVRVANSATTGLPNAATDWSSTMSRPHRWRCFSRDA